MDQPANTGSRATVAPLINSSAATQGRTAVRRYGFLLLDAVILPEPHRHAALPTCRLTPVRAQLLRR